MDKKDERILIELTKNSRIPLNQLAKKVGISREVANYRISQLNNKGIIKLFYTEIDESKLGFERFGCYVQLKGISEKEEKKFLELLGKNKYITYFGPVIGKYNVVFDIIVKSKSDLEEALRGIFADYKDKLKYYIINPIPQEAEFFPVKVLGEKKLIEIRNKEKELKLTKIDLLILKELRNNSRIEYKELSTRIKLSANAIKYRIKNMEDAGIISRYTIALDIRKLGRVFYNLQIKYSNYDFTKLKNFLRENKNVKYYYKHIGNPNWDLDIGLLIQNSEELREFLISLKEKFGDDLEINQLYLITEILKENIAPDVIFE